jgi:DNA-binding NarL/FixJ family response regulator
VETVAAARPIRVLLVDDDDLLREALQGMLEEQGFLVVGGTSDRAEAVSLARTERPDVALVDFRLNGTDGVDLTQSLKEEAPTLGVIMFTAYGEQSLVNDAVQAGANHFLVKGCPPSLISDTIRRTARGA